MNCTGVDAMLVLMIAENYKLWKRKFSSWFNLFEEDEEDDSYKIRVTKTYVVFHVGFTL